MKARFIIIAVILSAVSTLLLAKGLAIKSIPPFALLPYDDFNVEAQDFIPGLDAKNFQVMVPTRRVMDQIGMCDGKFQRDRIALEDFGVTTNYSLASTKSGFYLFLGSGALYFNSNGAKCIWSTGLFEQFSNLRIDGPAYSLPNGSAVAFFQHLAKFDVCETQLIRFRQESSAMEVLLSLPCETKDGTLDRIHLPQGFIAFRDKPRVVDGEPAQFYGLDGKPSNHPLANAINTLRKSKIVFHQPDLSPEFGALYSSQTKNSWALFPWDSIASHPGKYLFLLSMTDTLQANPVNCDRHTLDPRESLQFILIHPHLDLFLLGIRQNASEERIEIYLGHVQKEGNRFLAKTYKVRPFPEVVSPVFSRDGSVLLFASRINSQTHLVFAELSDILADINRRYPEAKLDLDALKAEVK